MSFINMNEMQFWKLLNLCIHTEKWRNVSFRGRQKQLLSEKQAEYSSIAERTSNRPVNSGLLDPHSVSAMSYAGL